MVVVFVVGFFVCVFFVLELMVLFGGNLVFDDVFLVMVEYVYGEMMILEKFECVVMIVWVNYEVLLVLGIVLVGMSKVIWGDDDDNGVLFWVEEKFDELGVEIFVLFDEMDGIDYEVVVDIEFDVIFVVYFGFM